MKNKFEKLISKEASKSSDVAVQVEGKGIHIDPINLKVHTNPNSNEAKTYSDVAVQTIQSPRGNLTIT